jgi:hypothetical protein
MDIERLKQLSAEDRKTVLESESLSVEEGKYEKPLTHDELAFFKDKVSELCIAEQTILDEFKEVKKAFKDRLDPLQNERREALRNVKFRSQEKEGRLYKMQDFEDQMIHKVDPDGNVIHSRKMLPEERQKWAFSINQKSA